jgi:acyl-homoserine lactone acylase PvdQ
LITGIHRYRQQPQPRSDYRSTSHPTDQRDRLQRIYELIDGNHRLTSNISKMQYDGFLPPGSHTHAGPSGRYRYDEQMKSALNHLLQWDGTLASDSIAAGIYQSFIRHMVSYMVFTRFSQIETSSPPGETGDLVERFMGKGPTPVLSETSLYGEFFLPWLTYQLDHQDSPWFNQEGGEKFEDFVRFAIQSAVRSCRKNLDPTRRAGPRTSTPLPSSTSWVAIKWWLPFLTRPDSIGRRFLPSGPPVPASS